MIRLWLTNDAIVQDADEHPNEVWRLVIEDAEEDEPLRTLNQRVQIMHNVIRCVLTETDIDLQISELGTVSEVTCSPNIHDPKSFWNVETFVHPRSMFDNGRVDVI